MKLISCDNVTKIYRVKQTGTSLKELMYSLVKPKYQDVISVNNISFDVAEGQCLGLLGTNGSGKSTLIKMFTGLLTPTSGEVNVLGHKPSERKRNFLKNIGVVFGHKSSLWWDLPLIESFNSHRLIYEIEIEEYDRQLQEISKAFGLGKILDRPVKYLSLGERVKAEITANLLHRPKILFLDEPTVGLDIVSKHELRKFIKKWAKNKKSIVVLTTHDMVDVEKCCDRTLLIEKGKICYDGDYQALKQKLLKHKILEIRPLEKPLSETEKNLIAENVAKISSQSTILNSSPQLISLEIDKNLNFKNIIPMTDRFPHIDIHLRMPTLEESLRDYYLNQERY